jgi:UDP:flavonoid glycosyltransferase YjiC (YdhE family)
MMPAPADTPVTMLYVSSNGAGLGHLTRIMALARRASPAVRPYVVSMSQAVPVVAAQGLDFEYIPSRGDLGIGSRRWNALFRRRFLDILDRESPAAVVFDGTYPYDGLFTARHTQRGLRLAWSRRGMWRPGLGRGQLARSHEFDLIFEPGDYAADADRGATVGRTDALRVPPITLLDREELLTRAEAATLLGTDPTRPTALVTLGAGNVDDPSSGLGRLVHGLLAVGELQVVVTRPAIADSENHLPDRVHLTSVYPVSRALCAVDLAVAAPGYNAFHELLAFGVPTAFVPNRRTALDDQGARASWAEAAGVGLHVEELDDRAIARVVAELGDPGRRAELADRCAQLPHANGARPAQEAVEDLLAQAVPA